MKKVLGIFAIVILLSASFVFADTNGVWDRAQDIRGGTFGSDEQDVTTNYTFMDPVYFMDKLLSYSNINYFINFSGRSQLNELGLNKLDVNYANVHSNLNVTTSSGRAIWAKSTTNDAIAGETTASGKSAIYGWAGVSGAYSGYFNGGNFLLNVNNIYFNNLRSCNGNLGIDSSGKLVCGTDKVNDADSDPTNELQTISRSGSTITLSRGGGSVSVNDGDSSPTNELPESGYGTYISNSRQVNVNTNIIQHRVTGSCTYGIKQINADGSVVCATAPSCSTNECDWNGWSSAGTSCGPMEDCVGDGHEEERYCDNGKITNTRIVTVCTACSYSCFTGNTAILLYNGSKEDIDKVRLGDILLSVNEKTGKKIKTEVVKTFVHPILHYPYYLVINNILNVTPNHPIYVDGKWEHAGEIKVGDILEGINGKITVKSIKKIYKNVPTYNLEVSGVGNTSIGHNYFAEGILVHNKG